jgi:predicted enzyme related to lactoylglutathione lyase
MKHNPVRWFEIYVEDMKRAKKFYEKVFAVKLAKLKSPGMEMWSFPMEMKGTGCAGALVHMDCVKSGVNSTLVYFASEDCAIEEARALKAGGKLHRSKMSIGEYGFISLVHDTEGNLIGLHSLK